MVPTLPLLFAICLSAIVSAFGGSTGNLQNVDKSLQPIVTVVEKNPATQVAGSLSMPEGSPWCDGRPTYWPVGHQMLNDTPSCLNENGEWEKPFKAVLDQRDDLNFGGIDRHDCVHLDVNYDGLPDVQCTVGAKEGTGFGYNELYITQEDGSLVKIPDGGGLQKYNTMRTRHVVTLADANGDQLMFIGVKGKNRTDGEPNTHRMFKNVYKENDNPNGPYFEEVEGPWTQSFGAQAQCVIAADINQDDLEDLVICNGPFQKPSFFIQNLNGTWESVNVPDNEKYLTKWRNVRVADFTGDGIPDIAVVKALPTNGGMHIFKGTSQEPFFDFSEPHFEVKLPHGTPDLEVLDVNSDGRWDIYVVQTKETREEDTYCARAKTLFGPVWRWWGMDTPNWVSPDNTGSLH